jgi:hypothetical protein
MKMFNLESIHKGIKLVPPRILIYGVQGVGKSSFAANSYKPIFIQTEDGLSNLDVNSFPIAKNWEEVDQQLQVLVNEKHDFKTLVFDSLDWFEPYIWQKVCQRENVRSIEAIPYGRGYTLALALWDDFISKLNYLRDEKGMTIILIGHGEITRFDDPEKGSWNRYTIKLHKRAGEKMLEFSDAVFFANYQVVVKQDDVGFGNTKQRALGSGTRIINTQEKPSFVAKNRYSLPDTINLDSNTWSVLADKIPYLKKLT